MGGVEMPSDKHIILINPKNGSSDEIKVGFSWTMLFFGIFVPLFRSDWKWFFILGGYVIWNSWMGSHLIEEQEWLQTLNFVVQWGMAFFYNRIYINERLKKGWYPSSHISEERLRKANFVWGEDKNTKHDGINVEKGVDKKDEETGF